MKFVPQVSPFIWAQPPDLRLYGLMANLLSKTVDILGLLLHFRDRFSDMRCSDVLSYADCRTSDCGPGDFGHLERCTTDYCGVRANA